MHSITAQLDGRVIISTDSRTGTYIRIADQARAAGVGDIVLTTR